MPVPKKNETEKEFISRCIPYVIKEGTTDDAKQAAAICHSIWKKSKGENKMVNKERVMLHLDAQMSCRIDLADNKEELKMDRCTMLVGDGTYNGVYFPKEELELAHMSFEKKPINLNHSADAVEDIVGYLEDVRFEDGKITAKPVFDEDTSKYKSAFGYMKSRFNAGSIPNVSVGVWLDRLNEEDENGKERSVARNLDGDHLALVVHGACNPEDGCGIGMSENQPIPISGNTVTITHEDYIEKNEEYEDLKKEILKEKIKEEKNE